MSICISVILIKEGALPNPFEYFFFFFCPTPKVNTFEVGDEVRIVNDERQVRQLQVDHGEWTEAMRTILGKRGRIVAIYQDGDIRVAVSSDTWTVNPKCLELAASSTSANSSSSASKKSVRR